MKNEKNQKKIDAEKAADRLESNLLEVETLEILQNMTAQDLEIAGILGDDEVVVDRPRYSETTRKEHLTFEPGVEYRRLSDSDEFSKLKLEHLRTIKDVEKGQLIAQRGSDERTAFYAGENVELKKNDDGEHYFATARGKTMIIRETMHVLPSDVDCKAAIRISQDGMSAVLDCSPAFGQGHPLTAEYVHTLALEAGVLFGYDEGEARKAVTAANQSLLEQCDVIIARGREPKPGTPGKIDYGFDVDADSTTFKILPDGRVDYKGSANIQMAKEGQRLASLSPPAPGIDGSDVRGKTLPAPAAQAANLIAGKGVVCSPDGIVFTAETTGCIVLNAPTLSIMELYSIDGDVDYSTGSVDFDGNIVVAGTVREGFEVKATGDVIVKGGVEAARVVAGRDVSIDGGIQGHGKGLVSAGRDAHCQFAQNARLEAPGNIVIGNFAVNSYMFCSHLEALSGHGSIVGGEVFARYDVDAKTVGSPSGTKTQISVGTDYLVRRKIVEFEEVIEFCDGNIAKIDRALRPVLELVKQNREEAEKRAPLVEKTIAKRKDLENEKRIVNAKIAHLKKQLNVEGACLIKVLVECHGDVYLNIKGTKTRVANSRQAVRFYLDTHDMEIKAGAY